jgi:hypothetical protein
VWCREPMVQNIARERLESELRFLFWEHLAMIGVITPEARLRRMTHTAAFDRAAVVRLLEHLLLHIPGKLLLVWDRLPAYSRCLARDFLDQGATAHLLDTANQSRA